MSKYVNKMFLYLIETFYRVFLESYLEVKSRKRKR
jgi:hypothetical protein